MKIDNRIEKISLIPIFSFLLGLVIVFSAVFVYLMYPSQLNFTYYTLALGVVLIILSFIIDYKVIIAILSSPKTVLWVNDIILILGIIGIGVILTYIAHRRNYRFDLTKNKLYSLEEQTIKILRNLDKNVVVTAFYPNGALETEMIQNLLNEYKRQSDKFSYKIVDPRRDPLTTKSMNVTQVGTVVVQCEANRKDIFDHEIFIRPGFFARNEPPKFQGEQAITSAILNVIKGTRRKIMFVKGHNEPSINSFKQNGLAGLNQYLVKENFDVTEANLVDGIATETQIIAIIGPEKEFHTEEMEVLKKFIIERKGHLFVAIDQGSKSTRLLNLISETYGIRFNDDLIINLRMVMQSPTAIIPEYQTHQIVKSLQERNSGVLLDSVRTITVESSNDWNNTPFLRTSPEVFSKRLSDLNIGADGRATINYDPQKDAKGPFTVAVALEGKNNASGSRAVFISDADFATNVLLQVQGNADLVMNAFNWLAGSEELISIRAKSVEYPHVFIDNEASTRIFLLCVVISPLLVVLLGGAVWLVRRRV